jgi:hypothetical protein
MIDAIRPSQTAYKHLVFESFSFGRRILMLPRPHHSCHIVVIDLKKLTGRTPTYRGYGLISKDSL